MEACGRAVDGRLSMARAKLFSLTRIPWWLAYFGCFVFAFRSLFMELKMERGLPKKEICAVAA
jgi:hypothetical protein